MASRQTKRLAARTVDTIKEPGRHADGGGLYLVVSPTGAKKWVFLYRWKENRTAPGTGKLREMGLGPLSRVSLAAAREAAERARGDLGKRIDPLASRRAQDAIPMFGALADELIARKATELRSVKSLARWRRALEHYAVPVRGMPVDAVTTADVRTILEPIWRTKPEMAGKVRGYIEAVLDAAKAKGHREGENPARLKGHLDYLLGKRDKLTRGHHAALDSAALPSFMVDLRQRDGVGAWALEFLILTAGRSGEVRGALWSEIDEAQRLWIIPAKRMKSGVEHRAPLSPAAMAILEKCRALPTSRFVFPGNSNGQLSAGAMQRLLERMKVDVNPHGFRATFRTWAAEHTAFPREIAEAALAHTIGDATERAYARSDMLARRRKLMEAWAAYANGGARERNVVQLRTAAGS